jgi:predicted glycoside hydrolase/deacetylase ChbG (UPF0249 family)
MSMPRQIAICADDFGLHSGINEAVLELIRLGILSATSCMPRRGAFAAGATRLRAVPQSQAEVGLHIDFSPPDIRDESPLALARFQLATYAGRMTRETLKREVIEQFDAFEAGMDRPPDYIDGHQHVHQLPAVLEVLLEQIELRYSTRKPWIRSTRPPGGGIKAHVIHSLGGSALESAAERLQLATNARLLGVHGFTTDERLYFKRLREWLTTSRSRDLLMCHPGAGPVPWDAIADCRRAEFSVLRSPEFAALLHELEIVVMPISAMAGSGIAEGETR